MKSRILIVIGMTIGLLLFLLFLYFSFFNLSDMQEFAIKVEITDPYPTQYLPITEWDLISMPKLLYAMNRTGIEHKINEDDWQEIYEFLEDSEGILEFAGDFYYVRLLRF